jgi:hypothetical protein
MDRGDAIIAVALAAYVFGTFGVIFYLGADALMEFL